MLKVITEFTACVIESIICTNFIVKYFGYLVDKFRFLKFLSLFTGAMICEILVTYVGIPEHFSLLCFVVIFTVISCKILNGGFLEKVLLSALLYFAIIGINIAVLTSFSHFLTAKYSELIATTGIIRILILTITKVILYFATILVLRFKKERGLFLNKTEFITIITTFLITASVGLSVREMLRTDKLSPTLSLYIAFCMVVLNVLLFSFLVRISQVNKKEMEMQILHMQLEQQEKSMCETDLRYEQISTIRHDMKNYISCALMLAENGDYDHLKEYLSELSSAKLSETHQYIQTESRVLNAVLNNKLSIAAENNIETECVITGKLGKIREIDISILFSNLLDNAIEACVKNNIPSTININMKENSSYLVIRITNTYDEDTLGSNPSLQTTKSDKPNHGFGLKSVTDITSKYSGSINFKQENNKFIAEIILCNI